MLKQPYGFDIRWSKEDQAYLATCPSFPHFSAFGDTRREAMEEAETALVLLLEEYADQRVAPPAPTEATGYSGEFRFRPGKALHSALAAEAERQNISMNMLATILVAQGLSRLDMVQHVLSIFKEVAQDIKVVASASVAIQRDTVRQWEAVADMVGYSNAGGPFQAEDLNQIVRANATTQNI